MIQPDLRSERPYRSISNCIAVLGVVDKSKDKEQLAVNLIGTS